MAGTLLAVAMWVLLCDLQIETVEPNHGSRRGMAADASHGAEAAPPTIVRTAAALETEAEPDPTWAPRSRGLDIVGQLGGLVQAVAIDEGGDTLFVGIGPRVWRVALDEDPPRLGDATPVLGGVVRQLAGRFWLTSPIQRFRAWDMVSQSPS
jgi:hypothetical protein